MKPKLSKFSLAIFFLLITSTPSICQDWTWQWAESITSQTSHASMTVQNCDFNNNLYCLSVYDTILFLPDTVFYHPEHYPGTHCCNAILKYNSRGKFQKAIDFYTQPLSLLSYTKAETDLEMNLYISTTFSEKIFIQDTTINSVSNSPDGLLMKLSPDFELIWVKLISGYGQDDIYQIIVNDSGNIFVLSHHYVDTASQVVFFGQDTVFSDEYFSAISKLDKNGNLLWRKDFYGNIYGLNFIEGKNGLFYWWGSSSTNIILDSDTTFFPSSWPYYAFPFHAVLTQDGVVEEINFLDLGGLTISEMVVNSLGYKYVGGIIFDTLFISGDTIIIPDDTYYRFIGKYNQTFEPLWYHIIPRTNPNQLLGHINLDIDDDNLVFSISTDDDLHIADTIMPIYYGYEVFIGEFGPDGVLNYILRTETNNSNYAYNLVLDNCKNPVISGSFKGISFLGIDTLASYSYNFSDGYIAKLQRIEPNFVNLGPDTLACTEYIIYGPPGYFYYSWNNTISNQSSYTTTETGTVTFACAGDEGCWLYDTVNVTIHPEYTVDLGPDTAIRQNESIIFTVPPGYESYLWSNTVTANSITVFGDSYEPGTVVQVWVSVTDGPCEISDTVYVSIKSEFTVGENLFGNFLFYPNPFNDCIFIRADEQFDEIRICDLNGLSVFTQNLSDKKEELIKVNLIAIQRGVYILKLKLGQSELIRKIVKL